MNLITSLMVATGVFGLLVASVFIGVMVTDAFKSRDTSNILFVLAFIVFVISGLSLLTALAVKNWR